MLLTNVLMLLLIATVFVFYQYYKERQILVAKVQTYAHILGNNGASALLLNDSVFAKDVLVALNRDEHVVQVALFTTKEEVLAAIPSRQDPALNLLSHTETYGFHGRYYEIFDPIDSEGKLLGYIYIKYSTDSLYDSLILIVLLTLGTVILLSLVTFWVTSMISESVSIPLFHLATIAQLITDKKDYSLRVESDAMGEIGTTIDAFNTMIKTIFTREKQLELSNDKLEESRKLLEFRVEERTRELQERVLQYDRARKESRKLAQEAQIASQTKDAFLANMSHEMRTPLHGVLGMTSLLDRTRLDEKQRQFVDTIKKASGTLLTIINDILDLSKIESGKIDLEMISFNLVKLLEEIVEILYPRVEMKHIALTKYIEDDVPKHLLGDPTRLKQILMNLTNNAIKFTSKGEVFIKCSMQSCFEDKHEVVLHFVVKDTGIGISDEQQKRLFRAFTQADNSTTRRFGGTGLGLVISKRLTEIMGGEMWVKSEAGKGSEFHFTIRLVVDKNPPNENIDVPVHLFAKKRALIVDDNETNRYVLSMLLKHWQIEAVEISSGMAALKYIAENRVDVVLLDYHMPEMDGLVAAKKIRDIDPKLPIVLAISASDPQLLQQANNMNIDNVLIKPLKEELIFESLLRVFQPNFIQKESVPPFTRNYDKAPRLQVHNRPLKILLAEDNPVNQFTASMMLEELGCRVDVVCDGQLALGAYEREPYDLIFMDGHMPNMDGYEATKAIRDLEKDTGKHIFIVAMTANALSGEREHCFSVGMDEYMSKPYTLQDIQNLLVRFCQQYKGNAISTPFDENPEDWTESVPSLIPTPEPASPDILVPTDYMKSIAKQPEKIKQLITLAISCLPQQLQSVEEAFKRKDWEVLERAAHTLKGTAANTGGEQLRITAYAMEQAAKKIDAKATKKLLPSLKKQTEAFLNALKTADWSTLL
ncbi:MAG: hypothetical protein A2Y14_02810 [Verrucomicrobia bacterium GWF2_51_19]|nr:MAG: hypothetical protein A2Y14_02810 [Verrucomicrobia bacterium GWF2_51_19]